MQGVPRQYARSWSCLALAIALAGCLGCETTRQRLRAGSTTDGQSQVAAMPPPAPNPPAAVVLASHQVQDAADQPLPPPVATAPELLATPAVPLHESLLELEAWTLANNPTLRRMQHEAGAEWARANYVAKLPDPSVGATVFTPPMNFEPDRQVAEFQVMQMVPWLARLRAEARQAYLEAMAAENMFRTETLRVVGDLRASWFKLYVLGKQIETTVAEQAQLESLIKTANARIATGDAQPGDVLMATLELSSLQEQLLSYRQQLAATSAEINRLTGRDVMTPVSVPKTVDVEVPPWDFEALRQLARESQPELNAARLRTAATRWGIDVARLKRRPDVTLGAGWILMDAPGAMMPGAGAASFTVGLSTTLPIWHRKYDAMTTEASREHYAAHASEEEVALRIDALLRDLWEQARASRQTVELYEKSILPQARQTFAADQKSLINNSVTFDRVIRDYRTLLNLELGYHRALGQYATTLARIRQTVGVELTATPEPAQP